MVNALYDFDVGFNWMYPYFGVGAGWAHNKADGLTATGTTVPYLHADRRRERQFRLPGDRRRRLPDALGARAVGDGGIPLLQRAQSGRVQPRHHLAQPFPSGAVQKISNKLDIDNTMNHSVLIGLRYAFNTAPAAPAAGSRAGRRPGARAGPHLPGVLRLGSRRPDRPRAPDHRARRRSQLDAACRSRGSR